MLDLRLYFVHGQLAGEEHESDRVCSLPTAEANTALEAHDGNDTLPEHRLITYGNDLGEGLRDNRDEQIKHDDEVENGAEGEDSPSKPIIGADSIQRELSVGQQIDDFDFQKVLESDYR